MIAPHATQGYVLVVPPDEGRLLADALTAALALGRLVGPARAVLLEARDACRLMSEMAANEIETGTDTDPPDGAVPVS